jgi:hypothetical protein
VTIILDSAKYVFDGGQAVLLRRHWAQTKNDSNPSALTGACVRNQIDLVVTAAGDYELFLAGGTIEAASHKFRKSFITLEPWGVGIASDDLEHERCSVRVPDAQLFLLSFSRGGKPIQSGQVTVYLEMKSFEITTDQAGTICVLGDPRALILDVEDGCNWDAELVPFEQ